MARSVLVGTVAVFRDDGGAGAGCGGVIDGKPVGESLQRRTLDFIFRQLATVPPVLRDERLQQQILNELDGNFLPRRVCENGGDPALRRYRRHLTRLHKRWPQLQFTRQRVP